MLFLTQIHINEWLKGFDKKELPDVAYEWCYHKKNHYFYQKTVALLVIGINRYTAYLLY